MKKDKKKKRRIRYDKIFICLLILFIIFYLFYYIFNVRIKNIYVINNKYFKDQKILEIAEIDNYPKSIINSTLVIKNKLEKNILIKEAKVRKKSLTEVVIEINENRPLFYNLINNNTVLYDKNTIAYKFNVPTLLNYIPDNYYDKFIEEIKKLDLDVLNRISEIKFAPNDVDDNRFLITMNDGNYVYINIATFNKLNQYLSILSSLPPKNGILYLDYGNNFEIIK